MASSSSDFIPPSRLFGLPADDAFDEEHDAPEEASEQLPDPYQKGSRYSTMKDATDALLEYTVRRGESYKVRSNERRRFIAICRGHKTNRCPFRLRFSVRTGYIITSVYKPHQCPPDTHNGWRQAASMKYLTRKYQDVFNNDHSIIARQVKGLEKAAGNEISYKQSWRTIEVARKGALDIDITTFKQVPSYLKCMTEADPDCYYRLEASAGAFSRLIISPGAAAKAFSTCLPLIALDGKPWKDQWDLRFLLAVTIDANNQALPLAWGVVTSESTDNWKFFLDHLRAILPSLDNPQTTIMTNGAQVLESALPEALPAAHHCICTTYLCKELTERYSPSKEVLGHFQRAIDTPSPHAFEASMKRIEELHRKAAGYLRNIDTGLWAQHRIPNPRYSHKTSSDIAGVMNSAWVQSVEEKPILEALKSIYRSLTKTFYERRMRPPARPVHLTDWIHTRIISEAHEARFWKVVVSSTTHMQAIRGRESYLVDLEHWTCSCGEFQDYKSPCRHAIACIVKLGRETNDYVHAQYRVEAYKATYRPVLLPIRDDQLMEDEHCGPCEFRMGGAGRPKKQRKCEDRPYQRKNRCTACHGEGHTRRSQNCPLYGQINAFYQAPASAQGSSKAWWHYPGERESSEVLTRLDLTEDLIEEASNSRCG